jgi:hypothetical protein
MRDTSFISDAEQTLATFQDVALSPLAKKRLGNLYRDIVLLPLPSLELPRPWNSLQDMRTSALALGFTELTENDVMLVCKHCTHQQKDSLVLIMTQHSAWFGLWEERGARKLWLFDEDPKSFFPENTHIALGRPNPT